MDVFLNICQTRLVRLLTVVALTALCSWINHSIFSFAMNLLFQLIQPFILLNACGWSLRLLIKTSAFVLVAIETTFPESVVFLNICQTRLVRLLTVVALAALCSWINPSIISFAMNLLFQLIQAFIFLIAYAWYLLPLIDTITFVLVAIEKRLPDSVVRRVQHASPTSLHRALNRRMLLLGLKEFGRRCPRCHNGVEKNGGCNRITCVCGERFDYGLAEPILSSNLNDVHPSRTWRSRWRVLFGAQHSILQGHPQGGFELTDEAHRSERLTNWINYHLHRRGKPPFPGEANDGTCNICEDAEASHSFSCGYLVCLACAVRWLSEHTSCPQCRDQEINPPTNRRKWKSPLLVQTEDLAKRRKRKDEDQQEIIQELRNESDLKDVLSAAWLYPLRVDNEEIHGKPAKCASYRIRRPVRKEKRENVKGMLPLGRYSAVKHHCVRGQSDLSGSSVLFVPNLKQLPLCESGLERLERLLRVEIGVDSIESKWYQSNYLDASLAEDTISVDGAEWQHRAFAMLTIALDTVTSSTIIQRLPFKQKPRVRQMTECARRHLVGIGEWYDEVWHLIGVRIVHLKAEGEMPGTQSITVDRVDVSKPVEYFLWLPSHEFYGMPCSSGEWRFRPLDKS